MNEVSKIVMLAVDSLKPYERNARKHGEEDVAAIAESIREFGFNDPIGIWGKDNLIVEGHGRLMAAKSLGMDKVPCIRLDHLTDEQRRAYALAHNRTAELSEWDKDLVSSELEDLKDLGFDIDMTGFTVDDIVFTEDMAPDITEEEVEQIAQGETRVQRGDVWILGRHRLMCGDSTDPADCKKLTGGGMVDMLLTDPPYNVDIGGKNEKMREAGYIANALGIENDNMPTADFYEFLTAAFRNAFDLMKPGASFYIWYASINGLVFQEAALDSGFKISEQLIWVKNAFVFGRSDYQWRHEPCLYGWKEGAAHYFIDLRSLTTVQDDLDSISREKAIERIKELSSITTAMYENKPQASAEHPTMKPLPLFEKLVRNSSRPGEVVLDLFGGSGTTLIACENLERTCYMMEFDPHYAEVILQRWEAQTGEKAVKAS